MNWSANPVYFQALVVVEIDGVSVDITPAVRGAIEITRSVSTLVPTASFTLSSLQLPFYVTDSLCRPTLVEISVWAGESPSDTNGEWHRVFRGIMEAPKNSQTLVPMGLVRCVGGEAGWSEVNGCLVGAAYGGASRLDLLEAYFLNAGITLSTDTLGSAVSGTVNKPLDIQGVSPIALLQRWGLVDGILYREYDGTIELLSMEDVAGPTAVPLLTLDASGILPPPTEECPQRPPTTYVLKGMMPVIQEDGSVVQTFDGGTVTTTYSGGVKTQEVVETEDETTTTTWTYSTSGGSATAQLLGRVIETVRDETTVTTTETYQWNVLGCYLEYFTSSTEKPCAPESQAQFSDPEYLWSDGSLRVFEEEQTEIAESHVSQEAYTEIASPITLNVAGFTWTNPHPGPKRIHFEWALRYNVKAEGYPRTTSAIVTYYNEAADGQSYQRIVMPVAMASDTSVNYQELLLGYAASRTVEDHAGPMPRPEMRSPTTRVYALVPMRVIHEVTGSGYPTKIEADDVEAAETPEELARVARWRARLAHADRLRVRHRPVLTPGESRIAEWSPVSIADPVRAIDHTGWIEEIVLTIDPAHGTFEEAFLVAIDPYPAESPLSGPEEE